MPRRRLLAGGLASAAWPLLAAAQGSAGDYPSRAIRLVVASSAGSSPDSNARIVAEALSHQLNQPVLVDNRPGASNVIGTDFVAKAAPDGYTLGYVTPSLAINPALRLKLPYAQRDLRLIVQVGRQPEVLAARTGLPAHSVRELIELARARPATLTYASTGPGSVFHLTGEMFCQAAGIRLVHVPYTSGPQAINDMLGGRIDLMFNALWALLPHLQTQRLLGLGITSRQRNAVLPDLPTLSETLASDFEVLTWGGLMAPSSTPEPVIELLNGAVNAVLAAPAVRRAFAATGYDVTGGTPAQFEALVRAENLKWSTVVERANIKLD